ncbi:EH domain-containing and endocytosis protein 1 [Babesia sp. Xinjiang]|uniref:EH domain-containing and endocytosis protein 1 n=1 Tax=Babesia sp. Xinjiang TaxID=462227 RepID=UPI000A21F30C|nr:EH domain-containing and endocytosis protein 1 [Babesia sp. Xinjiang]ORM40284.1 EH domain-containing and endocytosis protein 1 [Babesia sp. Xinjiang]
MAESFVDHSGAGWRRKLHDSCMKALTLSQAQDTYLRKLFLKWDRRGFGFLDGESARRLFRTSRLPDDALFDIWSVADVEGRGAIDYREFCICCLLIAYAQRHTELISDPDWLLDRDLLNRLVTGGSLSDCLPYFDNAALDIRERGDMPVMTADEASRYEKLFLALDRDGDGYLEGGDVREYYLMRNELEDSDLVRIWEIADSDMDGRLSIKEFMVMEHLVQYTISKSGPSPRAVPLGMRRGSMYAKRQYDNNERVTFPRATRESSRIVTRSLREPTDMPADLGSTVASAGDAFNNKRGESNHLHTLETGVGEPDLNLSNKTGSQKDDGTTGVAGPKAGSYNVRSHIESLKQHASDLEGDLAKKQAENLHFMAMYNTSENRIEQLHALHKIYSAEVEAEQACLRNEERELNELHDRIKNLRREKLKLESEHQALRDALMHTEDAEQTMLRSLRNEQGKVASIRGERIQTLRKTVDLLESINPSIHDTGEKKPPLRAINDRNLVRDAKGIRVAGADSVMERRLNPRTASHHHSEWSQKDGAAFPG